MKVTSRFVVPKMRVPWWGRLETRIIAALVLLGTLCVGASVYLVRLSVAYFDTRVGDALDSARELAEGIEAFHDGLVSAQVAAFEARTAALAATLPGATEDVEPSLRAQLTASPDVAEIEMLGADGVLVRVRDPNSAEVPLEAGVDAFETQIALPGERGQLRVVYRLDPEIDARYQRLGDQLREIGREEDSRADVEDAVTLVTTVASVLVLLGSMFAGFVVARTTTRRVSELSRVMTRVGQGELTARSQTSSEDEVGQLARAFNHMLDELAAAQQKVAYLQRIGAWQGMARRIAHEIKNPLTPIQLAVQQLRDKDPGGDPRFSKMLATSVEIVEDEIEGLRRMVASFSQFAKVPEVRPAPVSLSRVLEEFERAYGHLSDDETGTLEVRPPKHDVEIEADRQLLKQALVNLVENAVLSAREHRRDGIRVEIHTSSLADAVDIVVDDNGPGIDEARRERVFEPYETTRAEGTGLGLAIVKKVVLDHAGEIWIEDSPLGGARFVLRLPRLKAPTSRRITGA